MRKLLLDLIETHHHRIFSFAVGWASAPIIQALFIR
jgi:hypothetical protein